MNPFEKHGVKHLSASSLNTFVAQPAYWALRYLLKYKDKGNAKMWRGSAVEAGLDHVLFGKEDQALAATTDRFELDAQGEITDEIDKERSLLPAFLDQAVRATAELPPPTTRQFKFEHWFEEVPVPIVGYTDYEWPDFGFDLKTTHRIPRKEIPSYHARQIALYSTARQKPFKLAYCSSKDFIIREISLEEAQKNTIYLEGVARAVHRALSVSDDPHEVARLYVPDLDSFYWDEDSINEAKKIWEL